MSDDRWKPKPAYVPPDLSFTDEQAKQAFYPPKAEKKPLETVDPNEKVGLGDLMYRNDNLARSLTPAVSDDARRLAMHQGLSPDQRREVISTMAYAVYDATLPQGEGAQIFQKIVEHTITPPSDQQQQEWKGQTLEALESKYGTRANQVLGKVNAFVKAHPEFEQMLASAKLLNNPDVILTLASRSERFKPAYKR